MAQTYANDGYVRWGTQKVTIGGQLFTLKSGNLKKTSNRLVTMDDVGGDDAQAFVAKTATGDVTLVVPGVNIGAPFLVEFLFRDFGGNVLTMIISEAGEASQQDGVASITCQCYAKIN